MQIARLNPAMTRRARRASVQDGETMADKPHGTATPKPQPPKPTGKPGTPARPPYREPTKR